MKSICCTIWILGAFLVIAALDARPDPPALSPANALCKVLLLHSSSCETAAGRCDSLGTSDPFAVSLLAADACDPCRPRDRMVLTGQAADPSPPAPPAGHKLTFQS